MMHEADLRSLMERATTHIDTRPPVELLQPRPHRPSARRSLTRHRKVVIASSVAASVALAIAVPSVLLTRNGAPGSSSVRFDAAPAAAFRSESAWAAFAALQTAVDNHVPADVLDQLGTPVFKAVDASGETISGSDTAALDRAQAEYPTDNRDIQVTEYYSRAESEGTAHYCHTRPDFYVTCSESTGSDGRITLVQVQTLRVVRRLDGTIAHEFSADSMSPETLRAVMPLGANADNWFDRSVRVIDGSTALITSVSELVRTPDGESADASYLLPVSTLEAVAGDLGIATAAPS